MKKYEIFSICRKTGERKSTNLIFNVHDATRFIINNNDEDFLYEGIEGIYTIYLRDKRYKTYEVYDYEKVEFYVILRNLLTSNIGSKLMSPSGHMVKIIRKEKFKDGMLILYNVL